MGPIDSLERGVHVPATQPNPAGWSRLYVLTEPCFTHTWLSSAPVLSHTPPHPLLLLLPLLLVHLLLLLRTAFLAGFRKRTWSWRPQPSPSRMIYRPWTNLRDHPMPVVSTVRAVTTPVREAPPGVHKTVATRPATSRTRRTGTATMVARNRSSKEPLCSGKPPHHARMTSL